MVLDTTQCTRPQFLRQRSLNARLKIGYPSPIVKTSLPYGSHRSLNCYRLRRDKEKHSNALAYIIFLTINYTYRTGVQPPP